MKIARRTGMVWVAGSAIVLALAGLGAAACSTDAGTGNPTLPTGNVDSSVAMPGMDAGTSASDSAVSATDSAPPKTDGSTTGDAAGTCAKPPTLHPPKADAGIFCPYIAKVGNDFPQCTRGTQTCCLNIPDGGPTTPPSTCETTCAAGQNPWQCQGPEDCVGATNTCCLAGTLVSDLDCPGYEKAKGFKGTTCAASCPAGSFVACEANADCPNGMTCTAIKASGAQIGVCK